jgi:hypothetical protein
MSGNVLKAVKSDDWPETIHARKAVVRFPNGLESGHWQSRHDANTAEYTRTDTIPVELAQALARAEAAEAALEAEGPWVVETPNLEEYGHAIARATLEKAADECALWADRIAIRALANDPAALAEIVGRVNNATEKE